MKFLHSVHVQANFADFYLQVWTASNNTTEKFEVWRDYENLKYFWEPYKLNGWQARWYLKLQDYDFVLWHILEKTNIKADVLFRKNQVDITGNNKDVKLLKDELWTR